MRFQSLVTALFLLTKSQCDTFGLLILHITQLKASLIRLNEYKKEFYFNWKYFIIWSFNVYFICFIALLIKMITMTWKYFWSVAWCIFCQIQTCTFTKISWNMSEEYLPSSYLEIDALLTDCRYVIGFRMS